jgi:hypothetical protein
LTRTFREGRALTIAAKAVLVMSTRVQQTSHRRRFGVTEALLVAGILAFGGFALLSDGRMTPASFLSGFDQIIGD